MKKDEAIQVLIEYVRANETRLYRIAYSYVKDEETALDMVQDAIEKAIKKIHTLKYKEYVKTWFYRILVNRCMDNLKRKSVRQEICLEDYLINEEDKEYIDIYRSIDKLKPKFRTVIVLRYFENMKLEEIAQITDTNVSTVKTRLYKALKDLKTELM